MNPNQNKHHSVRRIILPSGRLIEVVRFEDVDQGARSGLHVCAHCHSDLVQPVAWAEAAQDRWELTLECPNCRWVIDGIYEREQVDQLEDKLDEGLADMLRDLQRLTQANMAEQIDRFVTALWADMILPEDF
jgi:hypothetical protein